MKWRSRTTRHYSSKSRVSPVSSPTQKEPTEHGIAMLGTTRARSMRMSTRSWLKSCAEARLTREMHRKNASQRHRKKGPQERNQELQHHRQVARKSLARATCRTYQEYIKNLNTFMSLLMDVMDIMMRDILRHTCTNPSSSYFPPTSTCGF